MKQAVIKIGSRQFNIEEGAVLTVNALIKPLSISVLYYTDGKKTLVGTPVLSEVEVKTSIIEEKRARKLNVGRFRAKSRYDVSKGYRDILSVLKIEKIHIKSDNEEVSDEKPVEKKSEKKEEVKKVAAKAKTEKKSTKSTKKEK